MEDKILLESSSSDDDEDVKTSLISTDYETNDSDDFDPLLLDTVDSDDIEFEKSIMESIQSVSSHQVGQNLIHMAQPSIDENGNIQVSCSVEQVAIFLLCVI